MGRSTGKANWVIMGGAIGELGYCTRCGESLRIAGPQRIEMVVAATRAFVKVHSRCTLGEYRESEPTLESWPTSRYVGVSSATIYYIFTGRNLFEGTFDVPHDPSDFGRCCRLLALAPGWEAHLGRVAEAFPGWWPFVREWPRLKVMYEEALRTRDGAALYAAMRDLEKEADRA